MTDFITQDITYPCSYDQTEQPARSLQARQPQRPLLVLLHPWSWGYQYQHPREIVQWCQDHDWNLIIPHFRGPSWEHLSCGHEAAVQDIVDAVTFACSVYQADARNVLLCGGSGGGFHTLLLAGRHPELWKAVSAWCPISDLVAWHRQEAPKRYGYPAHIEAVCGGNPQTDADAQANAIHRSPLTYLEPNLPCRIDINAGIHDGHTGSVPISHALNAFNACVLPENRIPQQVIDIMTQTETVPDGYQFAGEAPEFASRPVLFRKQAEQTTVTIFEGSHETVASAVIAWLSQNA